MSKSILSLIEKVEEAIPLYHITFFVFVGFMVYFRVLFNNFVWDDMDQVLNNPLIQHLSTIPYFFTASTFSTVGAVLSLAGAYYRPLMTVVFSFNHALWGLNPFGFHLFDVILHIANTIFVFLLLKRLFSFHKFKFSQTAAFIASSLYLVHPVNVESVAYISATSELLYTFFALVAIYTALTFCLRKEISIIHLSVIFLSILASLFSKESGIISVLLVLIVSFIYFRDKFRILFLVCLSSLGVYSIFRFAIAKLSANQQLWPMPIAHATLAERLLTLPYELFSYLRLIFFPKDLHISQADLVTNVSDHRFYLLLAIILIFAVASGIFMIRMKEKLSIFFLLWFLISLGLVLNIVPLYYTVEERWVYFPLIGFLGIISIFIIKVLSQSNFFQKIFMLGVISIFFVLFSLRTMARTADWQDALTLFGRDIKLSATSAELHNNYGVALYKSGDRLRAKEEFATALNLAPDNFSMLNNLGSIYAEEGNYDEAKNLYIKSIKISPTATAYENLAQIYLLTQKPNDTLEFLKEAIVAFPNSPNLNKFIALSLFAVNATEEAKMYAQKSVMLNSSTENINLLQQILK